MAAGPAQDGMAPTFVLQGIDSQVSLEAYRGRVVYVDFWASWCAPCRQSFPWMNKMHAQHAKNGLQIIAINLDENPADANAFLQKSRPDFVIAYDPEGKSAIDYRVNGMPSSFVVARDGTLSWQHIGFRKKDASALEAHILSSLAQP